MNPIQYALYMLFLLLLSHCETTSSNRKDGNEEAWQKNSQVISTNPLFKKFQEDMDVFNKSWRYKPVVVDYTSIPVNKNEPSGKPTLATQIGFGKEYGTFSPDGKHILTFSGGGATLWDFNGNGIRIFRGENLITHVAFSPDGNYILTGENDGTANLWDIHGNKIRSYRGNLKGISVVSLSSDGKIILTAGYNVDFNNAIELWDINGGKIQSFKAGGEGYFNPSFIALSPDGKYILIGGLGLHSAKLLDINGKQIRTFQGDYTITSSVTFSPDGKYILTGHKEKVILWDINGNEIRTFTEGIITEGIFDAVFNLGFSPDGKYFIAGNDKRIISFDINGNKIHALDNVPGWKITFTQDGKFFLRGGVLWDINGKKKHDFTLNDSGFPDKVVISPNKNLILTGTNNKPAKLWDMKGNEIRTFTGFSLESLDSAIISPNEKFILIGNYFRGRNENDLTVKLLDINGNEIRTLTHAKKGDDQQSVYPDKLHSLAFSLDEKYILTGSTESVKLWDINGNEIKVFTFKGLSEDIYSATFSPNGNYILTGGFDTARLWDTNGNEIRTFTQQNKGLISYVAFSPDGNYILTGDGKSVKLWSIHGKEIRAFTINNDFVGWPAFSPDGRYVIAKSNFSTKLWDINGKEIKNVLGVYTEKNPAPSSSDGKYIITTGSNTIKFSSITEEKWIERVISDLGILEYTNDGRFDYTDEKMKNFLNFRKGGTNELITFDSIYDQFYTPGLWTQFFSGKDKKPKKDLEEIIKKSPIPQVTTNTNSGESESATGMANVTVTACDRGGGAEDIRLYHNNTLVDLEATRGMKVNSTGKCQTKVFDVALFPGENTFRGSARNRENLWGYSDYLRLSWKPKEKTKPTQHLVVVGVNQYTGNTFSSLQYAVPDAKLFQESLLSKSKNLYGKTEVYELYDEAATREGIRTLLKNVANKVKPENGDVLILFFAGHGVSVDNQYYFIPAKYSSDASKSSLDAGAFPQTMLVDLVSAIHAEKKLIVLDSCQSGGSEWEGSIGRFSHASGVGIIAAAQSVQFALESSKFGHGLLTYSISDEIKNGQREKDGKLYLNILASRVKRAVEKLAAERKHKQDPYTMIKSDFELAE